MLIPLLITIGLGIDITRWYISYREYKNSPIMVKRNIAKKYINLYLRHAEFVIDIDGKGKVQHVAAFAEDKANDEYFELIIAFKDYIMMNVFFA